MKILILGCSAKKLSTAAAAQDIYQGPLWQTFRKYSDGAYTCYALSALHGLIPAEQVIEPYDCLLGRDVTLDELIAKLQNQVDVLDGATEIIVATSKAYASALTAVGVEFSFVEGGIGTKRGTVGEMLRAAADSMMEFNGRTAYSQGITPDGDEPEAYFVGYDAAEKEMNDSISRPYDGMYVNDYDEGEEVTRLDCIEAYKELIKLVGAAKSQLLFNDCEECTYGNKTSNWNVMYDALQGLYYWNDEEAQKIEGQLEAAAEARNEQSLYGNY